jgi:hypothetical protein
MTFPAVRSSAPADACPSWCATPHGDGLLNAHVLVCAEFTTRHGDVSVELEQSGDWPPVVALSIEARDLTPGDAGYTHLDADQARRLRDTLIAAVDLLVGGGMTAG